MQTLFETYKSQIPELKEPGSSWKNPPVGIRVICRCAAFHPKEFEAMLASAHGRKGLRWRIFDIRGIEISYPHRGWHPDSWRFKNEEV